MNYKGKLIALTSMMAMMAGNSSTPRLTVEEVGRLGKRRDERIRGMYDDRCKRMGLRLFEVGDRRVWALNLKNAHRKLGMPFEKKVKRTFSNDYSKFVKTAS